MSTCVARSVAVLLGVALVGCWQASSDRISELEGEKDVLTRSLKAANTNKVKMAKEKAELEVKLSDAAAVNERLIQQVALERAMPNGDFAGFFRAHHTTSESLAFVANAETEWKVGWRPDSEDLNANEVNRSHKGASTVLRGVALGSRSNLAFGVVAVSGFSPFLGPPKELFDPPDPVVVERTMWRDKQVPYRLVEGSGRCDVKITAVKWGADQVATPCQVVAGWTVVDARLTILVLGFDTQLDGIAGGPPYVKEESWIETVQGDQLYPLTAPQGIMLRLEDLTAAFRQRQPLSTGGEFDYHRRGWYRADWHGTTDSTEVVFAPLTWSRSGGAAVIHSLIFTGDGGSPSFWIPFWAIRDRLLTAENEQTDKLLSAEDSRIPFKTTVAHPWEPRAFQTALYDLLKRRAAI